MSQFGLKKTQVFLTVAILLLCLSVFPHSTFPTVGEDDDITEAEEILDQDERDPEVADGEDTEEEEDFIENADVQNPDLVALGKRKPPGECGKEKALCKEDYDCCIEFYCKDYEVSKHCDKSKKTPF